MQEQNQNQLRESSIPHEYYFGDLPGTLQYKKTKREIMEIENQNTVDNETCGFVLDFHTEENYRRLVPDTPTGNSGRWRLLLVMRKTIASYSEDDIIWLKGALENIDTGEISLMTSTNSRNNLSENRVLRSHDEEWFIGHYRMSAPMIQKIKYL